jgi:hypothetical protein
MWRKIHSNRDPRDTVYSELKKEFNPYFGKVDNLGKTVLNRYPKFFFGAMVLVMLVSMVLSFTVFRHQKPVHPDTQKQQINPVQDGFGQIMQVTGKIRETLRLKHLVDSISAKKQLSPADSTALDSALNQLQRIKTIK